MVSGCPLSPSKPSLGFDSLGTAEEHKRHAILDGGHSPPRNQLVRETLDWLDQYLGPVE